MKTPLIGSGEFLFCTVYLFDISPVYIAASQIIRVTKNAVLVRCVKKSSDYLGEYFWFPKSKFEKTDNKNWYGLKLNGYFTVTSLSGKKLGTDEIRQAFVTRKPND